MSFFALSSVFSWLGSSVSHKVLCRFSDLKVPIGESFAWLVFFYIMSINLLDFQFAGGMLHSLFLHRDGIGCACFVLRFMVPTYSLMYSGSTGIMKSVR